MTKTCGKCGEVKDRALFHSDSRSKGGLQNRCKACQADDQRARWARDPERRREVANRTRVTAQTFIIEYLLGNPCVDCGESDIVVLDFDHLGDKIAGVATLVNKGARLELIEQEIAKCEVVCSNDHRRRTAKRQNGYRLQN